jgi:hypothetical protein
MKRKRTLQERIGRELDVALVAVHQTINPAGAVKRLELALDLARQWEASANAKGHPWGH